MTRFSCVLFLLTATLLATPPASRGDDAGDRCRKVRVALALSAAAAEPAAKVSPPPRPCDGHQSAGRGGRLDWYVSTEAEAAPAPKVAPPAEEPAAPAPAEPAVSVERTGGNIEVYGYKAGVRVGYYLPADATADQVREAADRLRGELPTFVPPRPMPPAVQPQPPPLDWLVMRPTTLGPTCVGSA